MSELQILFEPFPHFIVKNIFSEKEQILIWNELIFLANRMHSNTNQAKDEIEGSKKRGSGIFLDDFYSNREHSNILLCFNKILKPNFLDEIHNSGNLILKYFDNNKPVGKSTLVQMYKNGDYYNHHYDTAFFTSVCLFHKMPKSYHGGDLGFTDFDYIPNLEHNSIIYFPSCLNHYVSEVKLLESENVNARFTISEFIHV